MAEPLVSSLVNAAAPENRPGAEPNRVGVFIAPQSLTTFAGASAAVNVIWRVLGSTFPAWGGENATLLVIALLVGTLVYLISENPGASGQERLVGIGVAIVNSFLLAAAALGISAAA